MISRNSRNFRTHILGQDYPTITNIGLVANTVNNQANRSTRPRHVTVLLSHVAERLLTSFKRRAQGFLRILGEIKIRGDLKIYSEDTYVFVHAVTQEIGA